MLLITQAPPPTELEMIAMDGSLQDIATFVCILALVGDCLERVGLRLAIDAQETIEASIDLMRLLMSKAIACPLPSGNLIY